MAHTLATAAVLCHQNNQNMSLMVLMNRRLCSDVLLLKHKRRDSVPKVERYFEDTIPRYSVDDFQSHFRVSKETFENLSTRLQSTRNFNKTTGPCSDTRKKLAMFLWYIGNLECFRSMADRFGVSRSTYHDSIKRTSSALVSIMPDVIKWPHGNQIIETTNGFSETSQLQNVIGAIDGTHVQIKAPKYRPAAYFNRKRFYSVVLLASCNSKLEFNYVWTGNPGSTHDATILRESDLFRESDMRIPPGFYFLGDSAFPILRWLITPFRDCGNLSREQKLFNNTHSKTRQVIERAFGLLKCRFRRLLRLDALDMSLIVDTILSACILHNLCIEDGCDLMENIEFDQYHDEDFPRRGHEIQGVRLRQQIMEQLFNL